MPLFKNKPTKKIQHSKIYMPKQSSTKKIVRNKNKSIFRNKSKVKQKRKINVKKYSNILLIFLIPTIFILVIFFAIKLITNIRNTDKDKYTAENVIGLENVPAYPNSEFIFKTNIEDTSVTNFISSGNSAYRIPTGEDIEDVYEYYSTKLVELGWIYIQTVPTASEEMKSGMYWTKEDQGLRIYSKFNDVWYEVITQSEAMSGLRTRVEEEIARELLLVDEDMQDLLPDFPWVLQIPKEYVISYKSANLENLRLVELKKLGEDQTITLTPISKYTSDTLDIYLEKYVDTLNAEEGQRCIISTTILAYTDYAKALKGTISCKEGIHDIAVLIDPNNNIAYILDSNVQDTEFFETVFTNIKPQDDTTY